MMSGHSSHKGKSRILAVEFTSEALMRSKPGSGRSGYRALSGRRTAAAVLLSCLLFPGGIVTLPPASAHEEGSSTEGYLLVQQALAHLAHDKDNLGPALLKVDEALAAADQEGVSVVKLEQAKASLQSGESVEGRSLLQDSIGEALSTLKPAVGDETGTTTVLDPLPARAALNGADLGFLAVSILAGLTGLALAYVFRPHANIRELRLLLASKHPRAHLPPRHEPTRHNKPDT